jgi:predicted MFS family arabinose efflux permease
MAGFRRFLLTYYAYIFLFDFILAYAIYTALFELAGLSVTQIGGLLAFWSLTAILFELPSGALSDRFDRRWLLVAAPLAKVLTFVCWAMAEGNVWLYGLGFLCWSVGQALMSGTGEALVYERLESEGRADDYDKVNGRATAAESLGIGTGMLLGGFVAAAGGMELTVWLSIPPLLLCALLALALRDSRRTPGAIEQARPGYVENFRIALEEFRTLPELRFVTLYIAAGLILFEALEEFDQLYYLAVSLPIWLFGVVGAATLAALALASSLAHRLSRRPALAWALPLLGGLLLFAASLGTHPAAVLVLELAYLVVVPATVLSEARFQRLMEGRSRATTTSAIVVAQNVTAIFITLGFGLLAEYVGILPAYGWAGLLMLPVAGWIFVQQRSGMRAIE